MPVDTSESKTYTVGPRTGGCLLVVIGLIILAVGIVFEWNTLRFLPGTVSTSGVVLSCNLVYNPNNGGTNCEPIVRFQTQAGQSMTFRSSEGSAGYSVGDGVTVIYHPSNPRDARLDIGMSWLWFAVLGLPFILFGLVMYFRGLINKSKRGNLPGHNM